MFYPAVKPAAFLILAAVLVCAPTPIASGPQADSPEDRVRLAARATYIHGMTAEIAAGMDSLGSV